MASFIAVYDACVLHPAPLRDLLLRLALTDLFRARWIEEIHAEWVRSVIERRSDLKPEQLRRTRELMDRSVPDCLVTGYESLVEQLRLPDPHDRHVLAAAICCQAGVIVTSITLGISPKQLLSLTEFRPSTRMSLWGISSICLRAQYARRCGIKGSLLSGRRGRREICLIPFCLLDSPVPSRPWRLCRICCDPNSRLHRTETRGRSHFCTGR